MTISDIDLVEMYEAFAAQVVPSYRQAPRRNISRQQFKEMLMAHHAVSAIECRKAIARRQTARGAGTAGPAHG